MYGHSLPEDINHAAIAAGRGALRRRFPTDGKPLPRSQPRRSILHAEASSPEELPSLYQPKLQPRRFAQTNHGLRSAGLAMEGSE